jgi:hypothetical protein
MPWNVIIALAEIESLGSARARSEPLIFSRARGWDRTVNGMSTQAPISSPNVMSADHQTEPERLYRPVRID